MSGSWPGQEAEGPCWAGGTTIKITGWTEGTADVDSDVQVSFAGFLNRSVLMVPKVCCGNSWVGGEYLGQASLGKS